jgi:hypothetical protein
MSNIIVVKNELEFDGQTLTKIFKKHKSGCKLFFFQENSTNNTLVSVEEKEFSSFRDLERFLWDVKGTQRYLAVIKDGTSNIITFRGLERVISYKEQANNMFLDYFREFSKASMCAPLTKKENKSFLQEIKRAFA